MTYLEQFEAELAQRIESAEDTASIVRWVVEQRLQSYRAGIRAGQNGAVIKRNGTSRRTGLFGRAPKQASSNSPRE